MRRLKEGFYSVMKMANQVRDKPDSKKELIEFSSQNKIEKPVTEAIIVFSKHGPVEEAHERGGKGLEF